MARVAALLVPGLALLLLAAHFFRADWIPVAGLFAAMVALLFVRAAWSARALQAALAIGTLEWLRTAWSFAAARAAVDRPYGRLLLILGVVATLTALAAWLTARGTLREHFRIDHRDTP